MAKRRLTNTDRLSFLLYFSAFFGFYAVILAAWNLNIYTQSISIYYRAVFLGVVLFTAFYFFLIEKRFYKGWVWMPWILFWTLYLFRIYSDCYAYPIKLSLPPSHYLLYSLICFLPTLVFLFRLDNKSLKCAFYGVITSLFMCNVLCFKLYGFLLFTDFKRLSRQVFGDRVLNPLIISYIGAASIIMGVFMLFQHGNKKQKLFGIILIITGLPPFAIGASRGAALTILICIMAYAWSKARQGRMITFIKFIIIFSITITLLIYALSKTGSDIFYRMIDIPDSITYQESSSERLVLWENAFNRFKKHYIFGDALEDTFYGIYPHNLIIESLMATGILGGSCFLILCIIGIVKTITILSHDPEHGWTGLLFIFFFIQAMFSGALYNAFGFWYILFIISSMRPNSLHLKHYKTCTRYYDSCLRVPHPKILETKNL